MSLYHLSISLVIAGLTLFNPNAKSLLLIFRESLCIALTAASQHSDAKSAPV